MKSPMKSQILLLIFLSLILILYACKEVDSESKESINPDNLVSFQVSSISGNTSESGGTATFTVKPRIKPNGQVAVYLVSSDTTEGTLSSTWIFFSPSNWSSAQTVTVRGVDDNLLDNSQNFNISLEVDSARSTDTAGYTELGKFASVSVTNVEDDGTPGFTVGSISGNTGEDGTTATFTIRLTGVPNGNVVIDVASLDTTEGTVSPSAITFTPSNWPINQTITVTGVDDFQDDGDQSYTIQVTINSPLTTDTSGYKNLSSENVAVVNVDNDSTEVLTNVSNRLTSESGATATFSVRLGSQPTSDVTIPLSSSDLSEGVLSTSNLTFTSGNWDTSQDVIVTGQDDSAFDTAQSYTILISAASSTDSGYDGLDPTDLTLYNLDDEYKLPDTGQTASYTSTTGEDSDYSIHPPSYTYTDDRGHGTVSDNNTGMMWEHWDDMVTRSWSTAITYCDNLTLYGYTDWRLPSDMELYSIVKLSSNNPSIDINLAGRSSYYWSSTTYASNTSYAWGVDFDVGGVGYGSKTSSLYVRCVRAGQ